MLLQSLTEKSILMFLLLFKWGMLFYSGLWLNLNIKLLD